MEKNKDKSHLIDQLYDYLEEQIQELKTDRNQLNHKMQDMIQEKNEKEGAINNQQKIYQIRKVFSPLPLEIEEEKQPVSEDMIQIEKEIHEFQMILREKEEKIIPENTKLNKSYMEDDCVTLDFSAEFLNYDKSDEKTKDKMINSIVNTLTQLTEVNQVKILIDGNTNDEFKDIYIVEK